MLINPESSHTTKVKSFTETPDIELYPRPQIIKGTMQTEEKNRFKQALLRYGKDWKMLEWKVGTRVRHTLWLYAIKFKEEMKKVVKNSRDEKEIAEAIKYLAALESESHKTFSKLLPQSFIAPLCVDTAEQVGMFLPEKIETVWAY